MISVGGRRVVLLFFANFFYFSYSLFVFADNDLSALDISNELPLIATAFVQTGNELHYFSEIEYRENLIGEAPVKSGNDDESLLNNQLQFSPKELDFEDQPTGIPRVQKVRVHNPTASAVRFDAISGSTVHLHCSFPDQKTIDPGEATFFEVIFLPRYEGQIENVLFVHSSLGIFTYMIRGKGITNPYRTRPHIGARIPMNGSFMSAIQVHNPHPNPMRVTEIYSSGGDLHLEVPDMPHAVSHNTNLWKIKPYETKTVMNARLLGAQEMNVTSFVKIKMDVANGSKQLQSNYSKNNIENQEETVIVPFQVEVSNRRGIFPTVDILDFGLICAGEKSASLTLEISSTLDKGIDIESLYVEQSAEPNGIYMEFASKPPISLKSASKQIITKPLAKIFFDTKLLRLNSKEAPQLARYRGRIIAESRGGNYNISVPYVAVVYRGSLKQREDETAFYSKESLPSSRSVTISNDLPFDIAIWNVQLADNAKKSFSVNLLSSVITLGSGQTRPVFLLKYISKERDGFASHCTLYTNVSTYRVPIIIFNGKLKITPHSIQQNEFDFGLIGLRDPRSIQFSITNENPVSVNIHTLRKGYPSITTLRLIGYEEGNGTVLTNRKQQNWDDIWQEGMDFTLPANSFAVFQYTIMVDSHHLPVINQDSFLFESDFERMEFPVKFRIEEGQILSVPDYVSFPYAFPGRLSTASVKVFSTFERDMKVLKLSSLSRDPRIFFESVGTNVAPVIKSGKVSNIGRVLFKPDAVCKDDCYLGMPLHTTDGQWFTYGMRLPQNLAEIDYYLYKKMRKKFLSLQAENLLKMNTTLMVDTEEVKNFPVKVHGELIWPRLLTRTSVRFPLTAVGNFTIVNLTLTNPSTLPVVVQLLPLVIYPDAEALVEFFRDELTEPLLDPVEVNETLMFSLRDTELFTLKRDSPVPKLRKRLEAVVGSQIPKFTLSMLLEPGMNVRIRVGFLPSDYILRSSLLLIRNNLTVIEPVVLYGCGARMDMQVEEKRARSKDPLLFVVSKEYLDDCMNPDRQLHRMHTTLTVKKHFVVKNTGEVPFTIVNMSLNNIPCENRGFRIINCEPFRLKPNQTHIIEIAYTPDFMMDWNEAALQFYMHMNGTSWMFPLAASIPYHFLKDCHSALPRPAFECLIYYLCVSLLVLCLICVLACSYLEGDRTVNCALRQHYAVLDPVPENLTVPENVSKKVERAKPRRHIIHCSNDSNFYTKWFYEVANHILRPFSWFWQFRSDQLSLPPRNQKVRKSKAATVKLNYGDAVLKEFPSPLSRKSSNDANGATNIEQSHHLHSQSETVNKKLPMKISKSFSPSTSERRKKHQDQSALEIVSGPVIQVSQRVIKADMNSPPKPKRKSTFVQNQPSQNATSISEKQTSSSVKQSAVNGFEKRAACLGFVTQSTTYLPKQYTFESKSFSFENRNTPDSSYIIVENVENEDGKCSPFEESEEVISKASLGVKTKRKDKPRKQVQSSDASPDDRSQDDRSEGGFSETSVTPEWADLSPINISECDVDEDFNALVSATQNFCASTSADSSSEDIRLCNLKKETSKWKRNMPSTYNHSNFSNSSQLTVLRSSAKKNDSDSMDFVLINPNKELKKLFSASRSSSCSALDLDISAKLSKTKKRSHKRNSNKLDRRTKPDGARPSAFIEQLYRERKFAEEEYIRNHHVAFNEEESDEVWPGFNLDLPALSLFDMHSTLISSNNSSGDGIWQQTSIERPRQHAISDASMKVQSPEEVTKAIKAFRLNPQAPPFVIEKSRLQSSYNPIIESPISQAQSMASSVGNNKADDPLGLSGSLFGSPNIWSCTATTKASQYCDDPNSPAMYWVDKILDTSDE